MDTNSSNSSFPDENVDPREKVKPEWLLKYSRAALYSYDLLPIGTIGRRSLERYRKIKSYAMGRQDVDYYKNIFKNGDDNWGTLLVTDWSIMAVLPKFRRICLGLLEKTDYQVQINPIDDLAQDELRDEIALAKAKIATRNALMQSPETAEIAQTHPMLALEADEPEDWDGIQIMELGIRHKTAMETEQLVELVMNANNFTDIRRQYLEDMVDCGIGGAKLDTMDNRCVTMRRVNIEALVINYCQYSDFRDWRYIGEVVTVPVSQLIAMSNGQVTDTQLREIWAASRKMQSGFNSYEEYYQRGKVEYLDLEIRSLDTEYRENFEDAGGNARYGKVSFNKGKKDKTGKYKKIDFENIYKCKWVIGTDVLFDYGKKENITRPYFKQQVVKSSFILSAVDFYNMRTRSRTEELITYADAIQMARYRLQHTLNTTIQKGYEVNISALEEINLSAGSRKMEPKDVLDLFTQRGILLKRTTTLDGDQKEVRAITPIEGGVGSEIAEYWNMITQNTEMMRQSIGLNELTDASTPNPKLLTKVAEAASLGTNNALSDLFTADRSIVKCVTEASVLRAQNIIKFGNPDLFISALGSVAILQNIKDIGKYMYGVQIVENPSQEELIAIQEQIALAQQAGQVTIANVLMLSAIKNIKQKQLYLSYVVKKNIERQQQEALQQQQQTGQIQMQSAMAAEEAKRQTMQMEYELKMQFERESKDLELRNTQVSKQYDLERERISASGRVGSSAIQAEERANSNYANNATKLITEGREDKRDLLNKTDVILENVAPQTSPGEPLEINNDFEFFPESTPEV